MLHRLQRLIGPFTWLAAACALGATQAVAAEPAARSMFSFEDRALDAVTVRGLAPFEGEVDLRAYASRLDRIVKERRRAWIGWEWWAGRRPDKIQYAQATVPPCLPGQEDCPPAGAEELVVTASKVTPSITNNQTAGVDEGDIVKQIGNFLLVLQDGRLFSTDTREGLRLADRIDVYRDPKADTWYDEMLVQGDHVLVTGYSYDDEASEISVFRLDARTGRLSRQGVFLISSGDYYDADNYATRVVGDRLVIYTPFDLGRFLDNRDARPSILRWLPESEHVDRQKSGRPLLAAKDIYRPVLRVAQPTLHAVSVCPLGPLRSGADLRCRSTAFLGPAQAEMYVSPGDVFLWTSVDDRAWGEPTCEGRAARRDVHPAAVYRVPIDGTPPSVLGAAGQPFDQFSMESRGGAFRSLVRWDSVRCSVDSGAEQEVALVTTPLTAFSADFRMLRDSWLTPLPKPDGFRVQNRYVGDFLVYGGRDRWGSRPPDAEDGPADGQVTVVPVGRPAAASSLPLGHSVLRIEAVGDRAMIDGYRDNSGLLISYLDPKAGKVLSRLRLDRRFESEGRSHAFNARLEPDGGALMGLPTVAREDDTDRWWWRSERSDLSFFRASAEGQLSAAGELLQGEETEDSDYRCEVSCVDWYGNTRPIFIGGRILGLLETVLVEARLAGGRIVEAGRLDLRRPPRPASAP